MYVDIVCLSVFEWNGVTDFFLIGSHHDWGFRMMINLKIYFKSLSTHKIHGSLKKVNVSFQGYWNKAAICPLIAWLSRTNKVCMTFIISKCIFSWRTESTLSADCACRPQGKRKTLLAQIWAQIHNNVLILTSSILLVSIEYQSPSRLAPSSVFCEPQTRINCKSIEQSTTDQ